MIQLSWDWGNVIRPLLDWEITTLFVVIILEIIGFILWDRLRKKRNHGKPDYKSNGRYA